MDQNVQNSRSIGVCLSHVCIILLYIQYCPLTLFTHENLKESRYIFCPQPWFHLLHLSLSVPSEVVVYGLDREAIRWLHFSSSFSSCSSNSWGKSAPPKIPPPRKYLLVAEEKLVLYTWSKQNEQIPLFSSI